MPTMSVKMLDSVTKITNNQIGILIIINHLL